MTLTLIALFVCAVILLLAWFAGLIGKEPMIESDRALPDGSPPFDERGGV